MENSQYIEALDDAVADIGQAIDSITYTAHPEINKRLIEKLEEALETINEAKRAGIFKP
jgi:hypothetical protein